MAAPELRQGQPPAAAPNALAGLQRRAFAAEGGEPPSGRAWSAAALADLAAEPATLWVEAFEPGGGPPPRRLLGFAVCRRVIDEAELLILCRDPAMAGRRLGRALLQALILGSRKNGVSCMFLEVGARNHSALALYAEFGFEAVGRRERYYHGVDGTSEDALVLRKQLGSP